MSSVISPSGIVCSTFSCIGSMSVSVSSAVFAANTLSSVAAIAPGCIPAAMTPRSELWVESRTTIEFAGAECALPPRVSNAPPSRAFDVAEEK